MHFDKRYVDRAQCVAQRNTGMRVRRGIDDDEIDRFLARRLDAIDQLAFVIALKHAACGAAASRQLLQALIDVIQGLPAIDFWLARAEQVQIRAMQNENVLRHCEYLVKTDRLFTLKSGICPLNRGLTQYGACHAMGSDPMRGLTPDHEFPGRPMPWRF